MARISPALPLKSLLALAAGAGLFGVGRAARGLPTAMGASQRRIATTATGSPQFEAGVFHNRLPSTLLSPGSGPSLLKGLIQHGAKGKPPGAVPLVSTEFPEQAADLAVTWLGHASVLIEIDGYRVLADPVWGDRVSPSATVGPQRMHAAPVPLEELPAVDAIVISHDHYDHLDLPTVRTLLRTQRAPFVVPIGISAHLLDWGVPGARIVELDWDGSMKIGSLTLTCTEARHFSGRGLRRNTTLWSSWALTGPTKRVYFGGDTGYTPAFAEIGARLGPFDVTLLPVGAYNDQWPDIHMNPEQAWRAHGDLGGKLLVPIHWGTFDLALHTWAEPVERLLDAAGPAGAASVTIPRPGARIVGAETSELDPWWRSLA